MPDGFEYYDDYFDVSRSSQAERERLREWYTTDLFPHIDKSKMFFFSSQWKYEDIMPDATDTYVAFEKDESQAIFPSPEKAALITDRIIQDQAAEIKQQREEIEMLRQAIDKFVKTIETLTEQKARLRSALNIVRDVIVMAGKD